MLVKIILNITKLTCFLAVGYFIGLIVNDYQSNGPIFAETNFEEVINFRDHSIDEQVQWALCYIDQHSKELESVKEQWQCPNPAYSDYFRRSVMGELAATDMKELIYCSQQPNLDKIIVVIGQSMYINVVEGTLFGMTAESAIPIATIEVCSKLYESRSFPITGEQQHGI